jgi:hypothetical protein
MNTNSIQTSHFSFKSPKSHFSEAYGFVRRYFRAVRLGYTQVELDRMMQAGINTLGEQAIEAAWKCEFAARVAGLTGQQRFHGWKNLPRRNLWLAAWKRRNDARLSWRRYS